MKRLILFIFILLFNFHAQAQGDGSGRVRQMRINFISERLHLPLEQNSRFLAVYTRYLDERAALRRVYRNQFVKDRNANNDEFAANKFVDDNIEYKQHDLDLSKKYKEEFLKVINAQQLVDLYQAERDFKQMLIQTLKNRRQ